MAHESCTMDGMFKARLKTSCQRLAGCFCCFCMVESCWNRKPFFFEDCQSQTLWKIKIYIYIFQPVFFLIHAFINPEKEKSKLFVATFHFPDILLPGAVRREQLGMCRPYISPLRDPTWSLRIHPSHRFEVLGHLAVQRCLFGGVGN